MLILHLCFPFLDMWNFWTPTCYGHETCTSPLWMSCLLRGWGGPVVQVHTWNLNPWGGPARRSLSWGQPRGIVRLVSRGWRGPTDHRISNSSQSPSDVQNLRNGLRKKKLIATTSLPIPIPSMPAILVLVSSNCELLHRLLFAWAWFDKYKSKFSDSTHKRSWDLSFGVLTLGSESKNRNS